MKFLKALYLASSLPFTLAVPALAGVLVNSPVNGANVTSPFTLSAIAVTCSSQPISAMGYSFDSSSNTTVLHDQSIEASVGSAAGTHTVHVKAWGNKGSVCVTDVKIDVQAGPSSTTGGSIVPSNAVTVSDIEIMGNWKQSHDNGGPGSSSGSTSIASTPSLHGNSRQFVTQYSSNGDERYSVAFADDTDSTHLFYDAWVYLTSSASNIANLEMDVNQVMANGETVLIGVQCDGYSGNWAYTVNQGSSKSPKPHWVSKSGTQCNPRKWSTEKWHHVQALFTRNDSGMITYHSVWLDGTESKLDATVYGAADLGWDPVINTQFQVDGLGSGGTATVYVDSLNVSRW